MALQAGMGGREYIEEAHVGGVGGTRQCYLTTLHLINTVLN